MRERTRNPQGVRQGHQASDTGEQLAIIDGLEFGNGVIEAEIAGAVQPGVFEGARGATGLVRRYARWPRPRGSTP
jgi:hypothetical protein